MQIQTKNLKVIKMSEEIPPEEDIDRVFEDVDLVHIERLSETGLFISIGECKVWLECTDEGMLMRTDNGHKRDTLTEFLIEELGYDEEELVIDDEDFDLEDCPTMEDVPADDLPEGLQPDLNPDEIDEETKEEWDERADEDDQSERIPLDESATEEAIRIISEETDTPEEELRERTTEVEDIVVEERMEKLDEDDEDLMDADDFVEFIEEHEDDLIDGDYVDEACEEDED